MLWVQNSGMQITINNNSFANIGLAPLTLSKLFCTKADRFILLADRFSDLVVLQFQEYFEAAQNAKDSLYLPILICKRGGVV